MLDRRLMYILGVGNLAGQLRLGVGTGATGDRPDGDLAELSIFSRALDEMEMRSALEYLAAKWGVE